MIAIVNPLDLCFQGYDADAVAPLHREQIGTLRDRGWEVTIFEAHRRSPDGWQLVGWRVLLERGDVYHVTRGSSLGEALDQAVGLTADTGDAHIDKPGTV